MLTWFHISELPVHIVLIFLLLLILDDVYDNRLSLFSYKFLANWIQMKVSYIWNILFALMIFCLVLIVFYLTAIINDSEQSSYLSTLQYQ